MYRLFFPICTNSDSLRKEETYCFIIAPRDIGVVNNQWWHKHLERVFDEPLDALAFGEEILHAFYTNDDCPCRENCAFNSKTELNYEIKKIFENINQEKISND
jgi:hypothetical protein